MYSPLDVWPRSEALPFTHIRLAAAWPIRFARYSLLLFTTPFPSLWTQRARRPGDRSPHRVIVSQRLLAFEKTRQPLETVGAPRCQDSLPPIRLQVGTRIVGIAPRNRQRQDSHQIRQRQEHLVRQFQASHLQSKLKRETPAEEQSSTKPAQAATAQKMISAIHTQPLPATMPNVNAPN